MSDIRRTVRFSRAASCAGKVPHETRLSAMKHAHNIKRRKRRRAGHIVVYLCEHCRQWHIGGLR